VDGWYNGRIVRSKTSDAARRDGQRGEMREGQSSDGRNPKGFGETTRSGLSMARSGNARTRPKRGEPLLRPPERSSQGPDKL
jgi:hypothetical protein